MDKVAGSKNDEYFTPREAVLPIIPYIKQHNYTKVWCPFDTLNSNFVHVLNENGFKVVFSHKDDRHINGNFFEINPDSDYDVIVSNPPYSIKNEVFERLFSIGKPFAMLVGVVGLFESRRRFELFKNNDFEIMYLNKRVSFLESPYDKKPLYNPPFSSVYLTKDVLPKQICFSEL